MLRSLRSGFTGMMDENILLDELPGGSKTQAARRTTETREEENNESEFIAMRSSSVPDIARSA
jgi:hypothetical protein